MAFLSLRFEGANTLTRLCVSFEWLGDEEQKFEHVRGVRTFPYWQHCWRVWPAVVLYGPRAASGALL